MNNNRKNRQVWKGFIIAVLVVVVAAGADAARQVYRFGNVRIDLKDGGVRTYKLKSVEIETISGEDRSTAWKRTYVFAEKDSGGTDTVKVGYKFSVQLFYWDLFQNTAYEPYIKDQWYAMEFIKTLPGDVFLRDCVGLIVVAAMWLFRAEATSCRTSKARGFRNEIFERCLAACHWEYEGRYRGILVGLMTMEFGAPR